MTTYIANMVKETATGTGLSNLALQGEVTGYRPFADAIPIGETVPYTIRDGEAWESGYGVLVSSTELSRVTIVDSSATATRVNNVEPGSPIKLSLSNGTHVVILGLMAQQALALGQDGSLADPTPFRATIFVDTIAAMKAQAGLADNETIIVRHGSAEGDGGGGTFYFDAADATAPDNLDTFRNDNYVTGLHKRLRNAIREYADDMFEIDAVAANGGRLRIFANPKSGAANDWIDYTIDRAASAWRIVARWGQASAKNFVSYFSLGTTSDRVEIHEPIVLPTRTDDTGLEARSLSWLSGASRLAMGAAASFWEIPLTKGGYIVGTYNTVTLLKAVDAAARFINGDRALVLGDGAFGDAPNFYVEWASASSATEDLYNVFRPSTGAAASGNGRWLRSSTSVSRNFSSGDATPSIKNGDFFVTAGATTVTDFDDAYEGQIFTVARGAANITIAHDPAKIDLGGANIMLTASAPRLMFRHVGGVHYLLSKIEAGRGSRFITVLASELDGVNDHVEIQAALDAVSSAGGGTVFALGTFYPGATIVVPKKCELKGGGVFKSGLSRTGNYGDTVQLGINTSGNTAQDAKISGFWLIHNHTYVAGTTTTLDNAVTAHDAGGFGDAHIRVFNGQNAMIKNIWATYLPFGIVIDGGTQVGVDDLMTLGIWDPVHAGLQEGVADVWVRRGTLSNDLPTDIHFENCYLAGTPSGTRSVDWGAGSPVSMAEDVGRKYGLQATCFEQITFSNGYIGGHPFHGVLFDPVFIGSGFTMTGTYLDGAKEAQIAADNGTVATIGVTFNGVKFYGASNSKHAVFVDKDSSTPLGDAWTFNGCIFRDHVKASMKLQGATNFGGAGNLGYNSNCRGLSTSDPEWSSIVYIIGSGSSGVSRAVSIGFSVGGSIDQTPASGTNYVKWGRYTAGCAGDLTNVCEFLAWRGRSDGTVWGGDIVHQPGSRPVSQTFRASGTYTPTPGVVAVLVRLQGSGGGGGGVSNAAAYIGAGGGAEGGYTEKLIPATELGATETVTIGAEGTQGANTGGTGGTGGTTSFGAHCSATGGGGGNGNTGSGGTYGGDAGVGSGGDLNLKGQAGMPGLGVASVTNYGGPGGGKGGGRGVTQGSGAGGAGQDGGGGAGATSANASAGALGGLGGKGYITIIEFFGNPY